VYNAENVGRFSFGYWEGRNLRMTLTIIRIMQMMIETEFKQFNIFKYGNMEYKERQHAMFKIGFN
jgi:hypothetical protein